MARTLTGDELGRRIEAIARGLPAMSAEALLAVGQRVFDKSQALVPVDEGDLKATGRIEIVVDGDEITLRIFYGGPAAPYAIVVHEDLLAEHDDGQAKFLEQPLLEEIAAMLPRLAQELDLARAAA